MGNYKSGCDSQPHIQLLFHKFLDKDQRIFDYYKPYWTDNLN